MKLRIDFLLTLVLLSGATHLPAAAPVVTNVVAAQRTGTKFVDIHYDVFDADADPLKIRLEISHNGGTNYAVPAVSLTGDVGANIASGTNKLIVWNAGADWDGEYSPLMRVRIIASDSRGYPGLEWGQEVPPGGFLMGQDGGAEGVGAARHVNIPWSFWLSKYEITVQQYADFLNIALTAGEVVRVGDSIRANAGIYTGVPANTTIYTLGTDIQWSLNKLEVLNGRTNLPVMVFWYGAIAFSQHFGYDLPTDAEWEKAARGADFDGLGEHRIYPWGNTIGGGNANYLNSADPYNNERTPVGYYNGNQVPFGPDMANGYGLYDMVGNVTEWTRTVNVPLENYPALENLSAPAHSLTSTDGRAIRGGNFATTQNGLILKNYGRSTLAPYTDSYTGFRVVRRSQ